MKRKLEWGIILFTLFFIFVVRFGVLEGSNQFLNLDLLSKSSIKNIRLYWPPVLYANGSFSEQPKVTLGDLANSRSGLHASAETPGSSQNYLNVLGAWGGLKRVFNRSDLAVEVIEGVREGVLAWRELKKYVEDGNKPKNKTVEELENRCPYSVSSTDPVELARVGGVQFPCGLVVDSSATVIATVTPGGSGDFKFELVGAEASDDHGSPPVILHYNVRILGDKLTDQAVIIQNSWTTATAWGEEERCPYDDKKKKQVDGLDTCIEQVGKVMTWKPPAERVSETTKWSSIFKRSEESKAWFPFAEGMPFAATIWVGWEGFHMTVNGKHISSFEYRQGLEPWLVNKFEVKGDLRVASIIATGLPTSESEKEVAGVEFLKAPPLPPKSRKLKLFIGVFSTTNNFERRMAIRRSWMQSEEVRSSDVVVRFFVGLHKQHQVNKEMWDEAKTYGDIQLLPFVDYYHLITLKTMAICIYATMHVKADYVMKTDDDSFVRIDAVLSAIANRRSPTTKSLLLGEVETNEGPGRDMNSKWYISEQEWPKPKYPPWAHGPGYIVSSDIARFVSQTSGKQDLKLFKLEDVAMGIWIDEFHRSQKRAIEYVDNKMFVSGGCDVDYIIAHYQNPRQMLCLWQELKNNGFEKRRSMIGVSPNLRSSGFDTETKRFGNDCGLPSPVWVCLE